MKLWTIMGLDPKFVVFLVWQPAFQPTSNGERVYVYRLACLSTLGIMRNNTLLIFNNLPIFHILSKTDHNLLKYVFGICFIILSAHKGKNRKINFRSC